jgi:ATP-dependent RNA helicase DeaD
VSEALAQKGYVTLTPIQRAVLAPEAEGRDLRLTSQTGSGKTVAIGFILRHLAAGGPVPRPLALVVTPTRELAKQVTAELGWLYAAQGTRIVSLTGGSSYGIERRGLESEPGVVVGTPGRVLDHLERGTFDASALEAIVLDEADRMLDLGFREDLEKIFAKLPEKHRTHLVSATFPREVERLAARVQHNPLHLEGTPLGDANLDIAHVVHLVMLHERFPALVNILLAEIEQRAIVFAKTRAEVADLTNDLSRAGFRVVSLSGEMEQRERNRALSAFREGGASILVATDVAARGLDVAAVDRVIHFSSPTDADDYTHRSGRTGRAGRAGTSHLLVAPRELVRVRRVLEDAGVAFRTLPVPSRLTVEELRREKIVAELTREAEEVLVGEDAGEGEELAGDGFAALARRLVAEGDAELVIARLLERSDVARQPKPLDITPVDPTPPARDRDRRRDRDREGPRGAGPARPGRGPAPTSGEATWVPFRVTWGSVHGADPRRLLAMVCRRGGIDSRSVGAIRIGPTASSISIASDVAQAFAAATARPDPRDRRVTIRPDREVGRDHSARDAGPARPFRDVGRDRPPREASRDRPPRDAGRDRTDRTDQPRGDRPPKKRHRKG